MLIKSLSAVILLCHFVHASAAEKWWPSKWGADDELGQFNQLGPKLTLKAAQLITTGKTYRLGIETNNATPAPAPRTFNLTVLMPNQAPGQSLGKNKFNYADDLFSGWMGVGSQIDGLGHAAIDHVFYNGVHSSEFITVKGLTKFGVDKYPPIVARGVLLDMTQCLGSALLPEGVAYTKEVIIKCEDQQGVKIEAGDVVLFHSGWLDLIETDPKRYAAGEPGLGLSGAEYLSSKDVIAVGADTWGVEVIPFEQENILYPVHQHLITLNGIYILENMDTRELARDEATEFMFVLGAARITGAVQMIINPIAIR
jgi:kynurenine formamidase